MIILNVGNNNVYFTLNEMFDNYTPSVSSYTQSYYVGRLTNKLTLSEIYFRLNDDTSTSKTRYNRFSLEVTPYNVTSSNQIGLTGSNWDFDSEWNYDIWAVNGSTSSFTFSSIPTGAVLLEGGRALIGDGTPIQHDLPGQFISVSYDLDLFWNSVDGENWTINYSPDNIGSSLFLKTNNRLIAFNTESGDTTHVYSEFPYQTWSTLTTPVSISKSFAYSSTLNRIIGFELNGSQMIYSDDEGDNWDTISAPNELTCGEIRVVWTGDKFVAISVCSGIGGIVAFSNDGLSWSIETNNIGTYPDEPLDIFSYIEDFGLYYIFKLYGKVLVSSNALNWYDLNDYCPQPVNALSWVSIKSNGLVVVAINSLGDVMTSTDGYEFIVSSTGFSETLSGLSWSPYLGLFVASSIDNTFISSTDGLNWISCSGSADSFSDIIWVEGEVPTPEPSNAVWSSVYLELDPQYGFATTITDIGPYGGQVYSLYLFNGGIEFSYWQSIFGPTVENDNPPIYGVIPDKVWMSEDEGFAILSKQWIVAETNNIFYLITFEPHTGGGYDLYYHGELDSPCGIGSFDLSTSPLFDTFTITGTCG